MVFKNINLNLEEFKRIESIFQIPPIHSISQLFLFIKIDSFYTEERQLLRKAINNNPGCNLIIISNNQVVSILAWEIECFHFMKSPTENRHLMQLKAKILNVLSEKAKKRIQFSTKNGIEIIDLDSICVIQGQGNYLKIYLSNAPSKLYTYRIGDLNNTILAHSNLVKLNKSLIVNINLLSQIVKGEAMFTGSPIVKIKLSELSKIRLKRHLFWLHIK